MDECPFVGLRCRMENNRRAAANNEPNHDDIERHKVKHHPRDKQQGTKYDPSHAFSHTLQMQRVQGTHLFPMSHRVNDTSPPHHESGDHKNSGSRPFHQWALSERRPS